MGIRALQTLEHTFTNPDEAYNAGYRAGRMNPYLMSSVGIAGSASTLLPVIGGMIGLDPNATAIASGLIDTGSEAFSNWISGVSTNKNLLYSGGNLVGNLGGTYLARKLTGTEDDPNGFIDTIGLIAGETVGDSITNAIAGDIKWKDVPLDIATTPVHTAKSLFNLIDKQKDLQDSMEEFAVGMKAGAKDRMAKSPFALKNVLRK